MSEKDEGKMTTEDQAIEGVWEKKRKTQDNNEQKDKEEKGLKKILKETEKLVS